MGRCACCDREGDRISSALGICGGCLSAGKGRDRLRAVRGSMRRGFGLPPVPPRDGDILCGLCANGCSFSDREKGFCGFGRPRRTGVLEWYFDPLPTNCVAAWVCGARKETGKNLAVFYQSCTLDCLYCQNWHFRTTRLDGARRTRAGTLASAADDRTRCICYFGGDPSSQMAHAIGTSRILRDRGVRICWETNGTMRRADLEMAVHLSLETGGCIKFDLKAWTGDLHEALTGGSNRPVLENFRVAARLAPRRPELPLVIGSTLLVPGYVGAEEVGRIAAFIASLDRDIPYSLLAFHPAYIMSDLPTTSRKEAEEAREAARGAGLRRVRVGNLHLLSW